MRKMLFATFVLVMSFSLFAVATIAQTSTASTTQTTISSKKPKVFIAPMENGFDGFISAALLENKVPVDITLEEESADYIIVGQAVKGQNKWYDTVFGAERDRNQGSIKLIRKSDKAVVWAGAEGDKSTWFPGLKRGGQEKVANRLARNLKKNFFNGKSNS